MKRSILMLIAIVTCICVTLSVATLAAGVKFTDVPDGSWYYDAVYWAVDEGVTNGTSETTFSPDNVCSRAEAVTFIWRALGSPEVGDVTNPFTDIEVGSWYYKAVLWAVDNNVTSGTSATTFSPTMECSRAQIVTFLYKAYN